MSPIKTIDNKTFSIVFILTLIIALVSCSPLKGKESQLSRTVTDIKEAHIEEILDDSENIIDISEVIINEEPVYSKFFQNNGVIDFKISTNLCKDVLNRVLKEYVDEVDLKKIFESIRNETALLLRDGGFSYNSTSSLPLDESIFQSVLDAYESKVNGNLLLYACIKGIIKSLNDKHSDFLTPEEYKEFMRKTREENYSGIGIRIAKEHDEDPIIIIEVFENSPAMEAGLKKGDQIIEIDGKKVKGVDAKKASELLLGKINTIVQVKIERNEKTMAYSIKRKQIKVSAVHYRMLDNNIGYIKIDSFKEELNREFREAYSKLERQGAEALILDLRNNPGGLVLSARELCGAFLPYESLVSTFKYRGKENRKIYSIGRRIVFIPTAIIVNSHTASSAEIASACLKDYDSAILIGDNTRGKGSVQRTVQLSGGCALKLTIERIFSPKGTDIDLEGVSPHYQVSIPLRYLGTEKDLQIEKAKDLLQQTIKEIKD